MWGVLPEERIERTFYLASTSREAWLGSLLGGKIDVATAGRVTLSCVTMPRACLQHPELCAEGRQLLCFTSGVVWVVGSFVARDKEQLRRSHPHCCAGLCGRGGREQGPALLTSCVRPAVRALHSHISSHKCSQDRILLLQPGRCLFTSFILLVLSLS